ncbi:sensor histidine kinase [Actinomycetospora termitidis]|uniref:Histidine kinase n=1 Tax=Actinomycetospora termitidis TaxID=3053470 RepID=A0ABT7ME65_9PSEU|nr:histidine kinase [Actinomycetospora sp. Odt1-22]MDL5158955.1 histidine kinase [Actinomycetospora sp. Odt1-22]
MNIAIVPSELSALRSLDVRPLARAFRRLLLLASALLGGSWAALWFAPDLGRKPFAAACVVVVGAGFAAAAPAVLGQPGRRRAGLLLGLAGALWPLNTLGGWNVGPVPFLRGVSEGAFWLVLSAAVVLYQHPRLARPERTFLVVAGLHFVGSEVLWACVGRAEWAGYSAHAWWPALAPDRTLFDVLSVALVSVDPLFAVALIAILVRRRRRESALDRYSLTPVIMAVGVAAAVTGVSYAIHGRATVAMALVLMPLPLAFLYGAVRLSSLRVRLGEALERRTCTDALRTVLRDPTLQVRFWSPEVGEWVDEQGVRTERPAAHPARWRIPIRRPDRRVVAEVETAAPSLSARRGVEAAVRLAGAAVENAGLRAQVRLQLEASRRAHARTVEAGLVERRNLERDLHDGAQQYLHAVLLTLARARLVVTDSPERAGNLLEDAREDVRHALDELRGLAHGLRPTVLLRHGLGPAIEEAADRTGLPVTVDVKAAGSPDDDAAVYFVVCEALTNAAKHAGADRVWVRVGEDGDGVDVDVRDDGIGGADARGSGIRGMADRVVARGGTFTVRSDEGHGTWVHAHLPRLDEPDPPQVPSPRARPEVLPVVTPPQRGPDPGVAVRVLEHPDLGQ